MLIIPTPMVTITMLMLRVMLIIPAPMVTMLGFIAIIVNLTTISG